MRYLRTIDVLRRSMSLSGPRKIFVGSQMCDRQTNRKEFLQFTQQTLKKRNRLFQLSWCTSCRAYWGENPTRQVKTLPYSSCTIFFVESVCDSQVNYSSPCLRTRHSKNLALICCMRTFTSVRFFARNILAPIRFTGWQESKITTIWLLGDLG